MKCFCVYYKPWQRLDCGTAEKLLRLDNHKAAGMDGYSILHHVELESSPPDEAFAGRTIFSTKQKIFNCEMCKHKLTCLLDEQALRGYQDRLGKETDRMVIYDADWVK